ncbi:phosphate ABC transporter permease subunit PstC [Aquipuribacter nitratireducens]|uniref:Phosphate transport system permease protein n=1 Tax=Aquipuribacter nitratireducens TaxID=650104 RepID=A0ABW0GQA0_9MICO
MTTDTQPAAPAAARSAPQRPGDRIFSGTALVAALLILVTLAAVAIFLTLEGLPALTADPEEITGENGFRSYVVPLLFGSVLVSILALLFAAPVAVGIALYISHYAPRAVAKTFGYVIDLLAAIPSVVFGFWGVVVFGQYLVPGFQWLEANLGFIPLFAGPTATSGRVMLTAALVLAVMILPIMTAVCREVFLQTPRLHEEAALALGATRWEMIQMAVLPYGRSGVISGAMLGLGRALGETLAVTLILSVNPAIMTFNLISSENPSTIPANIALNFPEATGLGVSELIATGLVLFVLTFAVNYAARWVASRGFSGAAG